MFACLTGWLHGMMSGLVAARLRAGSRGVPSLGGAGTNPDSNPSHCCACRWPKGPGETFGLQSEAVRARSWR